jgi:hypothetical protein
MRGDILLYPTLAWAVLDSFYASVCVSVYLSNFYSPNWTKSEYVQNKYWNQCNCQRNKLVAAVAEHNLEIPTDASGEIVIGW